MRPHRRSWFTGPLLFLAVLTAAVPAVAMRTIYDSAPSEAVLAATDMAFAGTVVDQKVRWTTPEETMIVTQYTVRVDRVLYDPAGVFGGSQTGDELQLEFGGGRIGDRSVVFTDLPELAPGESVILLIQAENLGAISPLVGGHRGLFRVQNGAVHDAHGRPVTSSFYQLTTTGGPAIAADAFMADLETSVDRAKGDPSLQRDELFKVPAAYRDRVFMGDQIPRTLPSTGSAPGSTLVEPRKRGGGAPTPVPDGLNPISGASTVDLHQGDHELDKYNFLWAIPDIPSVFNIPPVLYGTPSWGQNFEFSLSDWNRYASSVFQVFGTSDNSFGINDRNDFAFTNDTDFNTVYGFTPIAGWLGIAVMFNTSGGNIQTGEKIDESDVILNVGEPWTLDWATGYNNDGIWYFPSTAVHEIGHCIGREHQFTGQPTAQWHSVMNYPPAGALDNEFWLTFMDDAQSIRAAYLANTVTTADLGVYLFRTNGTSNVQWATFPSSVMQNDSFTISNYAVENLGTSAETVEIDWWLTTLNHSYAGSNYYMGTTNFGSLGTFSFFNLSTNLTVPCSVPPGNYFISAILNADSNGFNDTAWSFDTIQVLARPNAFVPTTLTPISGSACQSTNVCLDWLSSTNSTQYQVQWGTSCGTGSSATTTSTFYCPPGLSSGVTYWWRVRGVNECGIYGSWSSCKFFTTSPAAPTVPAQVAPADGITCQSQSACLDWTTVGGATNYQVQIGGSCGIGSTYNAGSSLFCPPGLTPDTTYTWRVRAQNNCGVFGAWSGCRTFTTSPSTPAPPTMVSPTASATCQPLNVCMDWTGLPDATNYNVQIGLTCGSGTTYATGNTIYCPPGLIANTTYHWRTRAQNDCVLWGTWSACREFSTPEPPVGVGPVVSNVAPTGTQSVTIDFSKSLDIGMAGDPSNYRITMQGGTVLEIVDAAVSNNRVTLYTAEILDVGRCYTVDMGPLEDRCGNPLEGAASFDFSASSVVTEGCDLFACPGGDGPGLSSLACDITVFARDVTGSPISGLGIGDFELDGCTPGNLAECANTLPSFAEIPGGSGNYVFTGPLSAGGTSDGLQLYYPGQCVVKACLPINVRTADLDFDGVVGLADVGYFAADLASGYSARADLDFDNLLNLGDVGILAVHLGHGGCMLDNDKQPQIAIDAVPNAQLTLSWDPEATVLARSTQPQAGEPFTFYVGIQGNAALEAWEAELVLPAGVKILHQTLAQPGAIDVLTDAAFVVGLGATLHAETSTTLLATVEAVFTRPPTDQDQIRLAGRAESSLAPHRAALVADGVISELGIPDEGLRLKSDVRRHDGPSTLLSVAPNPFNPMTEIRFHLAEPSDARLSVYDLAGRLVRTFDVAHLPAGTHGVTWRGTDNAGAPVASGVYLVRLAARDGEKVMRITLLK